ncbi:MAG: dihydroxyacetone kinase subunit DhaK [Deltaproteobacteria bacterium]|jgi:dihydroxyacetone kinase-like protein|nr:dihydroxyacetone kinase subunit DhaK [Deltaproteobacteria bacterium]
MKKIINNPDLVVEEMLYGLAVSNPQLAYDPEARVISRKEKKAKVGLVSGGGSGHEPAHAGYVGTGMLDAAVAGNVFASPPPDRVLKGIEAAQSGQGVLLIIKNYSGDTMNFGMAAELARDGGTEVAEVIVKDDVAVPDSTYSTGRRGVAGTVFVHKIAGAAAEEGLALSDVSRVAQKTADNVRSFGISLSSCILPAVGKPGFSLAEDEIELGMGIHGEPGVERVKTLPAAKVAEVMVDKILADLDYQGSECAAIVNGCGGTPLMELYILAGEVDKLLKAKGVNPIRYYVGQYMTSLEMAGASLSLLRLDAELKQFLFAPADTPAFKEKG